MGLTKQQIVSWLQLCAEVFSEQRDFLTQLDTEIGDGDHGLNMNRGFNKVVEKLPSFADKDIGFILKNTGMTLLSSVGGPAVLYSAHSLFVRRRAPMLSRAWIYPQFVRCLKMVLRAW